MMRDESRSFTLSDNNSDFKFAIYPPIKLDENGKHEIALLNIDMYHSIPNIDEFNNKFVYEYNGEKYEIIFPTGAYEIEAINNYIQEQLVKNNHSEAFSIKANTITLKCIINIIKMNLKIYFYEQSTFKELLGFKKNTIDGVGEHEGETIVNILS